MTGTLGQSEFPGWMTEAGARLAELLRRAGAFLGRAGFGIFLAVAAVIVLLATTLIGVTLLIAAGFLGLARGGRTSESTRESTRESPVRRRPARDPGTLDARPTADGWVIEPAGR